jgi:glutaminyl-tRNA synthetase
VRQNATPVVSNFLRQIIAEDNRTHKYGGRVVTRFPPEPNGYLHIGHAKSICLNFGLASENGGVCHLRFDDTNPIKEDVEYEDSIKAAVKWLGFDWAPHLYHASDYFDRLYDFARHLIKAGLAYVDSSSGRDAREGHADRPTGLAHRERDATENLIFGRMKKGEFADGAHVPPEDRPSRTSICDPAIYRIRHDASPTGDKWCVCRCKTTRIRYRTRWNGSRIRSARSSSRTTVRSTIG